MEPAAQRFEAFKHLSTHQLEDILRADLNTNNSTNEDAVYQILTILEEREQGSSSGKTVNIETAWKSFQENYDTPEGEGLSLYPMDFEAEEAANAGHSAKHLRRKHPFLRGTAIAAVVLCMLLTVMPGAAGSENLFVLLGTWTDSIFHFVDRQDTQIDPTIEMLNFHSDNEELRHVFSALSSMNVNAPVVPTWIPDGFTFEYLSVREMPDFTSLQAIFQKGAASVTLLYTVPCSSEVLRYEKDTQNVTKQIIQGIPHYFFCNNGQNICTWVVGNVECLIAGDLSADDLAEVINSIYMEVATYEKTD